MGLIVFLILGEAPERHEVMFKLKHLIATLIVEYPLLVNPSEQLGIEHILTHAITAVCSVFICALNLVLASLHQSCCPDKLHLRHVHTLGPQWKCFAAHLHIFFCSVVPLAGCPQFPKFAVLFPSVMGTETRQLSWPFWPVREICFQLS